MSRLDRTLIIATFALILAAISQPAHAYLDPTSGSMILQAILGGFAGAAVVLKLYWHRILGFFGVKKQQHDEPPT